MHLPSWATVLSIYILYRTTWDEILSKVLERTLTCMGLGDFQVTKFEIKPVSLIKQWIQHIAAASVTSACPKLRWWDATSILGKHQSDIIKHIVQKLIKQFVRLNTCSIILCDSSFRTGSLCILLNVYASRRRVIQRESAPKELQESVCPSAQLAWDLSSSGKSQ